MPDGHREHERVAAQLAVLERRVALARRVVVLLRDHEVHVAEPQRRQRVLGLGLDQLALQLRVARLERPERRDHERVRAGLEARHADAARDVAGRARQIGLGRLQARDHRVGVAGQPVAGLRELHAAADALDQPDAGVALERGELLGDRRGRVGERLGDGRDRAARGELAQEPEPSDVEHREADLTGSMQEHSLDVKGPRADTVPMTSPASLSLRHATDADAGALAYLSELDEAERLTGSVLVAFEGDRPVAAMSLEDGRAVADPFTRSAAVVDLLRLRARQERSGPARRLGLGLGRLGLAA